jgi:3-phosphoshikimate 1-carboxyvinyltransferase
MKGRCGSRTRRASAARRATMVASRRLVIHPVRRFRGALRVPGDKSISHRYALLAGAARGTTSVTNLAPGADVAATLVCLERLGVKVDRTDASAVRIDGLGWGFEAPDAPLDAANSGTTLRLLAGLLAGLPFRSTLTGDASLRRRPMQRIIDPLTAMGAEIASADGRAPLTVGGGQLRAIDWQPAVASAQVKSAILLAGLQARGRTTVRECAPTRDHTERAFPLFGLEIVSAGLDVSVDGAQTPVAPRDRLLVPGDPSSAAVWAAAAAAVPGSVVRIEDVCLNPRRLGFVAALRRMGAHVTIHEKDERAGESVGTIEVVHDQHTPTTIGPVEVPGLIDELPVLAARAALGGGLEVLGAGELRVKESDRITALVTGLRALGVDAREQPDGFVIEGRRRPAGGTADAAGDHRLVLAFALVASGAAGPSTITGADAVSVSYPGFEHDLGMLTA